MQLRAANPDQRPLITRCKGYEKHGSQVSIFVSYKGYEVKGKVRQRESIRHESLLPESKSEIKKKHPISNGTIDLVWNAIPMLCKSNHRQMRNELCITLLERLGARKSEIFEITISDCSDAILTGKIKLKNSKQKIISYRRLPIRQDVAARVKEYIEHARKPIVREAISRGRITADHGQLLVGEYGRKWGQNSLNKELDLLSSIAGIVEPVAPQLFRHRAATLMAKSIEHLSHRQQTLILKQAFGWSSDFSSEHYIDVNYQESKITQGVNSLLRSQEDTVDLFREVNTALEKIIQQTKDPLHKAELVNVTSNLNALLTN